MKFKSTFLTMIVLLMFTTIAFAANIGPPVIAEVDGLSMVEFNAENVQTLVTTENPVNCLVANVQMEIGQADIYLYKKSDEAFGVTFSAERNDSVAKKIPITSFAVISFGTEPASWRIDGYEKIPTADIALVIYNMEPTMTAASVYKLPTLDAMVNSNGTTELISVNGYDRSLISNVDFVRTLVAATSIQCGLTENFPNPFNATPADILLA